MRLYSTRESTNAGEPTVLAIVETLLAVGLLVVLSLWLDTAKWLAGAVCIAPLLLLRTWDSVAQGVQWWDRVSDDINESVGLFLGAVAMTSIAAVCGCIYFTGWWTVLLVLLFAGGMVAGLMMPVFLVIRFGATLLSVLSDPIASLCAIRGNWQRVVLATDSATEPEFVPGDPDGPAMFLADLSDDDPVGRWFSITMALGTYPFAAAYRWSVKATCLIYLPLIWLITKACSAPASVMQALDDFQVSDLRRIRVVVSVGVLLALAGKIALMFTVAGFVGWWNEHKILLFLKPLVAPQTLPLWQLASALNSVLAIGMWLYARHVKHLATTHRQPSDRTLLLRWRVYSTVALALSLYTIACTVLIIWKAGNLPETLRQLWGLIRWQAVP